VWSIPQPDGSLVLVDTRSDATTPQLRLAGLERVAYEYCDETHSGANITQHLCQLFPDVPFDQAHVIAFLNSLVANRLMVSDGVNYLSLAITAEPVEPAQIRITIPDGDSTPSVHAFIPLEIIAQST
jgi:hypothetical protein